MFCFQGGFEYKRAIVESVITIIEENPEAKEAGLFSLRDYFWNSLTLLPQTELSCFLWEIGVK